MRTLWKDPVPVLIAAFFWEPPLGGAVRRVRLVAWVLALSGGVLATSRRR